MARVFVAANHPSDVEGVAPLAEVRFGGEYFFLYPDILRVQAETGQLIDPQRDALFRELTLASLRRFVQSARERTLTQPQQWSQRVGRSVGGEAVLQPASRAAVLELLDAIGGATDAASAGGLGVWFVGD